LLTSAPAGGGFGKFCRPKFAGPTIKKISSASTTAIRAPSGKYRMKPARRVAMSTSSIITTNRNNTMTAPTYTKTRTIPRNSASNRTQSAALLMNASTRKRTA
jgi:hypothetical protein